MIFRNIGMKAKIEKRRTRNAVEILDRMAGDDAELKRLTEEARINAKVARMIYDAKIDLKRDEI
jgi:hypothetical protein